MARKRKKQQSIEKLKVKEKKARVMVLLAEI